LTNQSLRLEVFDLETRRDGPQDRYDAAADGDNGELYIVFSLSLCDFLYNLSVGTCIVFIMPSGEPRLRAAI